MRVQHVGWRLVCLLAAACLSAGCGFHLRTYNMNSVVSTAHVSAPQSNFATQSLRRGLKQAGLELTEAEDAEVVIELLEQRRERRSVSVTDRARAAEYETSLGVRYEVLGPDGKVLIPSRWVQLTRIFRVDAVNIVASSQEQALLEREMITDLVGQIIRALDVATRELVVAG